MTLEALLTVDIPNLDKNLGSTKQVYTDFGKAIQAVASSLSQEAETVSSISDDIVGTMQVQPVDLSGEASLSEHTISEWDRRGKEFASVFRDIGKSAGAVRVVPGMDRMREVSVPRSAEMEKQLQTAERGEEEVFGKLDEQNKIFPALVVAAWDFILERLKNTMQFLSGVLGGIPGGWEGGFMAGVLGSISLSYTEMDRKRAQMGEMANTFASGVDSILAPATRKAVGWFGRWAEHAQWYYGVGREEVQKTVGTMVDTSFTVEQIQEHFDSRMGDLGKNIVVASIAVDKHFNTQTGTAMKDIVSLVRDHGMQLHDAGDLFMKMAAEGQNSGMGGEAFIRATMSSGRVLSQFGGNLENVAVMMSNISKAYQSMGLDRHYAGKQAIGVAEDLAAAFMNVSKAMQVELMRRMDNDTTSSPYTLQNRFNDALRSAGTAEGETKFRRLVETYLAMVGEQQGRRKRSEMVRMHQQILGIQNQPAVMLQDYGDTLFKGDHLKADGDKIWDQLKRATDIESRSVNSLEKTRRSLITGMSEIGQGLLALLTNLVAAAIFGLRSLPMLWQGLESGNLDETLTFIGDTNRKLVDRMGFSLDSIADGIDKVGNALGAEFRHVYQPVIDILKGKNAHLKLSDVGLGFVDVLYGEEWGKKAAELRHDPAFLQFERTMTDMETLATIASVIGTLGAAAGSELTLKALLKLGLHVGEKVGFAAAMPEDLVGRLMAYYWETKREEDAAETAKSFAQSPEAQQMLRKFNLMLEKRGYKWDPVSRQMRIPDAKFIQTPGTESEGVQASRGVLIEPSDSNLSWGDAIPAAQHLGDEQASP